MNNKEYKKDITTMLIDAWYRYFVNRQEKNKPGFTGDKNNPVEVWRYNSMHGIDPVETINHGNGHYTHIYDDGTKINIHVTSSSIIDWSEGLLENNPKAKKLCKKKEKDNIWN